MQANPDALARYLDWLDTEMRSAHAYHDHKERMAWTATAFYLAGVIALVGFIGVDASGVRRWFLAAVVALIAAATYLFVGMQFRYRSEAVDRVCALRRVRVTLLTSPGPVDLAKGQWKIPGKSSDEGLPVWPGAIESGLSCYGCGSGCGGVCCGVRAGGLLRGSG